MSTPKTFPVMLDVYGNKAYLPWDIVEPWRQQVMDNHNQTLERLKTRGGLTPMELWCAAHTQRLTFDRTTEGKALLWFIVLFGKIERERGRIEGLRDGNQKTDDVGGVPGADGEVPGS